MKPKIRYESNDMRAEYNFDYADLMIAD